MQNEKEIQLLTEISKKFDLQTFVIASQGKTDEQINVLVTTLKLPYADIAPLLGLSPDALKMRISRWNSKKGGKKNDNKKTRTAE